jgi:hypothetical protein
MGLMVRLRHAQEDRGLDFYQTPPCATQALLRAERLPHGLWEPHCGYGAIAEVLLDAGHAVYATDVEYRGYAHQLHSIDFLKTRRAPVNVDGIVMNPPFAYAAMHIQHALTLCPYVCALLRLTFMEAGNETTAAGRARLWCLDSGYLARVHVFTRRLPMMHREGWTGKKSTSTTAYAWFVFDGDHCGPTTIDRI